MSAQLIVVSRWPVRRLALPLLVLAACEPDPAAPTPTRLAPAVAQSARGGGENPVIRWNSIAADLMVDPGPIMDSRAFAILHAAIHDAVNGVERRYRPYTADLSSPKASLEAAVATVARDVLLALSPSQRRKIEHSAVRCSAARTHRLVSRMGQPRAVRRRSREASPRGTASTAQPRLRRRPERDQGARPAQQLDPHRRTDRHRPLLVRGVPHLGQDRRQRRAEGGARPLGCGPGPGAAHFAAADAGFACFAAKYRFRFWRPYTAIRRAAEDGNPATEPGAGWLPLLWTRPGVDPQTFLIPPIPEYPSQAATVAAAAAEVLIAHLGDRNSFEATSIFLPGVTRRFDSFTEAAKESGRSRVYGGIHFSKAVRDGYRLGKSIGGEVSRSLPPMGETGP